MKLLRAATLTVADLDRSIALYRDWLDHRLIEHGALDEALAASWGAPKTAGARTAVLEPASGAARIGADQRKSLILLGEGGLAMARA